jgi:glycosyltransferase involved in cell wall biosynthesis
MLEREQGVIVQGFVQPDQLPEALARATCLVLPSFFEPWALVVHEAAAAGLLIIASDAVGSVPHLVQDGYNGFTFRPRDVEGLAELMERIGQLSGEAVHRMSMASFSLAQQFTPERWADTLIDFVQRMTPLPRTNITLL